MENKTLVCVQCDAEFNFSVSEQNRCLKMGFDEPRRCPDCRNHRSKGQDGMEHSKTKDKKKHYRIKNAESF